MQSKFTLSITDNVSNSFFLLLKIISQVTEKIFQLGEHTFEYFSPTGSLPNVALAKNH